MYDNLNIPSPLMNQCLKETMLNPQAIHIGMYLFHNGLVLEKEITERIVHVRYGLNEGFLEVGDDSMLVLFGGDIKPQGMNVLRLALDGLSMTVSLRLNNMTRYVKLFLV